MASDDNPWRYLQRLQAPLEQDRQALTDSQFWSRPRTGSPRPRDTGPVSADERRRVREVLAGAQDQPGWWHRMWGAWPPDKRGAADVAVSRMRRGKYLPDVLQQPGGRLGRLDFKVSLDTDPQDSPAGVAWWVWCRWTPEEHGDPAPAGDNPADEVLDLGRLEDNRQLAEAFGCADEYEALVASHPRGLPAAALRGWMNERGLEPVL